MAGRIRVWLWKQSIYRLPDMSVNIKWIGHACFQVWREGGPIIVTDPYDPVEVGLGQAAEAIDGDVVICSSLDDRAHGHYQLVRGKPRVINALEVSRNGNAEKIDGSELITLGASEGPGHLNGQGQFEAPRDNALYAFEAGGLWIMHMGDVGYGLRAEEMQPFVDHCDVLLALVGQTNTISLQDLDFLVYHLKPKWVLPMHYRLPPIGDILEPIDDFLARRQKDKVIRPLTTVVEFPLETGDDDNPTIVVLDPAGYVPV